MDRLLGKIGTLLCVRVASEFDVPIESNYYAEYDAVYSWRTFGHFVTLRYCTDCIDCRRRPARMFICRFDGLGGSTHSIVLVVLKHRRFELFTVNGICLALPVAWDSIPMVDCLNKFTYGLQLGL